MSQAANFAKALYDLSITEQMLDEVLNVIDESAELSTVLKDPTIFYLHKERILRKVFEKLGSERTLENAILYLCKKGELGSLKDIRENLREYREHHDKILRAKLTCIISPTPEQKIRICSWLKKEFNKQDVILEIENDPTILGGFVITAEDKVYDHSILGSLNQLKQKAAGTVGGN